jgi:hypothetical protein
MDLEILEGLALGEDRSGALAQLLPGSQDHDYYRCLHAQHAGRLDEAEQILEEWGARHGHDVAYERLRLRQLLLRVNDNPDAVRDHFGVQHWHEAEVAEIDPTRATKLVGWDPIDLLRQGAGYGTDLSQVTDEGLYELLGWTMDTARRRVQLGRLAHTQHPKLVDYVVEDLQARGSFGSLAVHGQLTLEPLHECAARRPELKTNTRWLGSVFARMQPPAGVDLELDREAREAYLVALWNFVETLPAATNSIKAHVLWHLLDTRRRRGAEVDLALLGAYLKLPRAASYVSRTWIERVRPDDVAQLGSNFQVTNLPAVTDDQELVRDLLQHVENPRQFADWLDHDWLEREIAAAQLLLGRGDADKATLVLGPAEAAALRERVELAWCLHNPVRFAIGEPMILEADVKHVPELVVKVFRIDPLAYFQHHGNQVRVDIDLDGLAASHEFVMRFAEPPIRRVRRRIELAMCTRAGTYVVDLIGNGIASRAVIQTGRLRHVARLGAAGHVVTVLDDHGKPLPAARAWIGDREYVADERGELVVPFSTQPRRTTMLLMAGDVAQAATLDLEAERYALHATVQLDRQSLSSGRTAKAIARVHLTVAGVRASLALLERPRWSLTITDRHGVSTTKEQPLVVDDEEAAVLEIPVGEELAYAAITIAARIKVVSQQRDEELTASASVSGPTMHGTAVTEALYLAQTAGGWVLSALGKGGEPRARRPVSISISQRWSRIQLTAELATDERGRIELGELPGAVGISATLGAHNAQWVLEDPATVHPPAVIAAGEEVVLAIPASRQATEMIERASLVELRARVPLRHVADALVPLAGAIAVRGLPPGEYALRAPGLAEVLIRIVEGVAVDGQIVTASEVVELSRPLPAVAALSVGDALVAHIAGAGAHTRIHVIATRFTPTPIATAAVPQRALTARGDRARGATYVSGRELGDEIRYVLERRSAKRFPGLQLDKPTLLLNPWARRTTTTDIAPPRPGAGFAAAAPAQGPRGGGGAPRPTLAQAGPGGEFESYDFLGEPPVLLANLEPDEHGVVRVPLADLGRATCVSVIVDDPAGISVRRIALLETDLAPRDLRLRLALDPARHATQKKAIAPLRAGDSLVIEDLATAKLHLIDSIGKAHAYLLSLRDDPALREFSFVTRWHELSDPERRELYSKYACHELHLFLNQKDRAFFDAVVRPYLAHKRTKTFLDHYLLDADLSRYLEPAALSRLNAVECALLARRIVAEPALVRLLADQVAITPLDPRLEAQLIDTLLGASTLDADEKIADVGESYMRRRLEAEASFSPDESTGEEAPSEPTRAMAMAAAAPPPAARMAKRAAPPTMTRDLERRRAAAPMYRAADKTQEWAENNWWHLTPAQSGPEMIAANRLWRGLAQHERGAFLSPWLGLATGSFAEMMSALSVIDLPFVAGVHAVTADGARLTVAAAGNALAGTSQIVDGELVTGGSPLVVGQSYVRADDRTRWVDGEQVDKYVEGPLSAGVVYTCVVVIANPTSSRQRVAALVQIPRGSIAVAGARPTHTIDLLLEPYGTAGHEYSFYFPAPGTFTHFPVHVSRAGSIVAAVPGRTLVVTAGGAVADTASWSHVSQHGSLDEVLAYLEGANLAETDLDRIAWRMKDRAAYTAILSVLDRRRVYPPTLYGYALLHRDAPRIRGFLRMLGSQLLPAGPVLDMIGLDAEDLGAYEHLELAPLVNARAHRLGGKLRILNDGLAAQYGRFLDLVAHRAAPAAEDLLAAASFLLAQDRHDAALAMLARVSSTSVTEQLQYAYLSAYAACLTGDVASARMLAEPWRELPVDRWRRKFEALLAMLAELGGAAPAVTDPKHREEQHADLAAKQPAFELAVDREGVIIRAQHVAQLELRFFEMDVELLFSRQPFVQSDVSRFSYIEPGHREVIDAPVETRVAWPQALRGKNVVVEAVGAGQRKAKIHYANDLATTLAHQVGQVRVQRADGAALPSTYVKVYARQQGGGVAFFKDGYTDLRGWFDYATLSTDDLDRVERFAILVASDAHGSSILEAPPPAR